MVIKKDWKKFEKEIIAKNQKFYIYGAGLIYQKIIPIVGDFVYKVLDIRADTINDKKFGVSIVKPDEIAKESHKDISVLSCLNPFQDYLQRTDEVANFLEQYDKSISLYYLDYKEIEEKGILFWHGKELLINNLIFLVNEGWKRSFVRLAYTGISGYGYEYMKKLYDEPIDYILYERGKIGLKDYNNDLIIHKNGRKETTGSKGILNSHHIWLFGDSRVSGMLNSSDTTFASYLQKNLSECGKFYYDVINCGIPGRDIERMLYQIQTENFGPKDIVILATGFYEYEGNVLDNVFLWSDYIKLMNEECKKKNTEFIYLNLPTILEMDVKSELEKEMLAFFNTTEFTEYNVEQMKYCKNMIHIICEKNGVLFFDFAEQFKDREKYGHVFINLHHYGPNGNKLIGDGIFEILDTLEKINTAKNRDIERLRNIKDETLKEKLKEKEIESKNLQVYLDEIKRKLNAKKFENRKIGSIVMNANPFTNGHLYLVEEAIKKVDFLIVFVVSEDVSFFSFTERYEMVYENLKENKKVLVVHSGKYCISKQTFPDYFKKEDLQGKQTTAVGDLELFASRIAPELSINIRFVGEEPEDTITKQYNMEMKKILPSYGVEVIEIPRKKLQNNTIISASRVRKFFKEDKFDEIKEYVSEITWNLLKKYADSKEI